MKLADIIEILSKRFLNYKVSELEKYNIENINIIFLSCPSETGRNVNAIKCKTGRITYRWSLFIKQANDAVEIIKINDRAKYSLYLVMENIFEVK